ncbi:MAG: hypothetical protein Q9157_009148 [Trypethelium eluteriae]
MGKSFITEMDKFKAKLFKIEVENEVLEHENQGLKEAVKLEQRRRKGRKAMKMPNKHGGAVIYTPSKVQAIRDANIAKEQAEQQKQQEKHEKQLQKQAAKQIQREAKAQRHQDREKAQSERRAQKEAESQQKQEAREQHAIDRQVQNEVKHQARYRRKQLPLSNQP